MFYLHLQVSGISQSGKTVFTRKIIENRDKLIYPVPLEVYVCYAEYQDAYSELAKDSKIKFIQGLDFKIEDATTPKLIVIDDMMTSSSKNKNVQELFIRGVHHTNTSVIFITQNIFNQGKYARDMRLNTHYLAIFRSPTFMSQVSHLGRQLMPHKKNFILEAYKDATQTLYSYVLLILHPCCSDMLRVRTGILPGELPIVYIPE